MDLHLHLLAGCLLLVSGIAVGDTHQASTVSHGKPNPNCSQFQTYGFPSAANPKILLRGFYTCREGYAALYDPADKTPLWVAEHLTKSNFSGNAERDQLDFVADPDIPHAALPLPLDYENSGFDKGHMAPAADFKSSQRAMNATFQFANVVPQTPQSNRGLWKQLEDATRDVAVRREGLYVITGPIFSETKRPKLNGRVSIPTSVYKILIDSKRGSMTGFVIPNSTSPGKNFRVYQAGFATLRSLRDLISIQTCREYLRIKWKL